MNSILFPLLGGYWVLILLLLSQINICLTLTSDEMFALHSLWQSSNGPNWNYTQLHKSLVASDLIADYSGIAMWNFTGPTNTSFYYDPCLNDLQWAGLMCSCSPSCVITGIALPHANLEGNLVLAPVLGRSLINLMLAMNKLDGTIPKTLSEYTNLQSLRLHDNNLEGSLPSIVMKGLQQLREIDLNTNNLLTGTIPWLQIVNITSLVSIELYKTKMSGSIPEDIRALTNLNKLDLTDTMVSGQIPNNIGELVKLEFLFLGENHFTGTIPNSFVKLKNLIELKLHQNNLSGTIPAIGETHNGSGMRKLVYLFLQNNSLVSTVPYTLGRLGSLHHLDLSNNILEGSVPRDLTSLLNLQSLRLSHNNLHSPGLENSGETCQNSHMRFLDPYNQRNLSVIDVSYNSFSGKLDTALFKLPRLEVFNAEGNCFCGSIPVNICDASNLQTLVLSGLSSGMNCRNYFWEGTALYPYPFNGFDSQEPVIGELPSCLWKLPKIQTLHASGNKLLGTIPNEVSPSIKRVDLGHNHISGTITRGLATASNLLSLSLDNNNIAGTLDVFDDVNPNLALYLSTNRFSGELPNALQGLAEINILSGNIFSCDGGKDDLPSADPSSSTYNCGSSYFNFCVAEFFTFSIIVMIVFGITWLSKIFSSGSVGDRCRLCWKEVNLWLVVSNGSSNSLLGEIQTHQKLKQSLRSLARYSRGLARLRLFTVISGSTIFVVFISIYSALTGNSRKLSHTYLWSSTAAYLTGYIATSVLLVSFVIALLFMCYLISSDASAAKKHFSFMESRQANEPKGDSSTVFSIRALDEAEAANETWLRRILIPMIRLLFISSIHIGVTIIANALYLYVYFRNYSSAVESSAGVALSLFKILWTGNVVPALFQSQTLSMGVPSKVHDVFVRRFVGDEIFVRFMFNNIIWVIIPILSVAFQSKSCFYGMFIAQPAQVFEYRISQCVHHDDANICDKRAPVPYWSSIQNPFVYNYTCTSSIMAAYIPIHIQTSVIMLIKSCMRFYSLVSDLHVYNTPQSTSEAYGNVAAESPTSSPDISPTNSMDSTKNENVCNNREDVSKTEENDSENDDSWWSCIKRYSKYLACLITVWLYEDSSIEIYNGNVKDSVKTLTAAVFAGAFSPTKLLWTMSQRRIFYKKANDSSLLVMNGSVSANSSMASYLGSILILFTFGLVSPILAFILMLSISLDTFISQITLGKFIVVECTVVVLHENLVKIANAKSTPRENDDFGLMLPRSDNVNAISNKNVSREGIIKSASKHLHHMFYRPGFYMTQLVNPDNITELVSEIDEPWGAIASLFPVIEECSSLPVSLLNLARYTYVVLISTFLAFVVNDTYNSEAFALGGISQQSFIPGMIMATTVPLCEIILITYSKYSTLLNKQKRNIVDEDVHSVEMRAVDNPLAVQAERSI